MINALCAKTRAIPSIRCVGYSAYQKSGDYAWKNRKPSAHRLEGERLKVAIKAAHDRGLDTYGPDKV